MIEVKSKAAHLDLLDNEEDILVVITIYNPNIDSFKKNLVEIKKQFSKIVICNNSNADYTFEGCIVINLHENLGIAKAQNIGIDYGFRLGVNFFIFFDQDTYINSNFRCVLTGAFNRLSSQNVKIGTIGPRYFFSGEDDNFNENGSVSKCDTIISSGSLVHKNTFIDVGFFDESLFIDLVDHEFCWRVNRFGYSNFIINDCKIIHELGDGIISFFGIKIVKCAPVRHYYVIRNSLSMLFRSYVPLLWKIKFLIKLPLYFLSILSLGDIKKRLLYSFKGIKDFISK